MVQPLLTTVKETCIRNDLLAPGAHVLIAVSGGQDSCALLHILATLRDEWQLVLSAAHFNHGLRGEGADADAGFAQSLCSRLGVPMTLGCGDVSAAARRTRKTIQEAARDERKRFLKRTAADLGADLIAVAHTADDRAETVLLNLFRGTGMAGLCAMPPREGRLVRPLCELSREQTGAYCRAVGILPRQDASNRNLHYSRNRIRADVLPYIEAHIHPSVRRNILRMADLLSADHSYLCQEAERVERASVTARPDGSRCISASGLSSLHPALRTRVVRRMIASVARSDADVTASQICSVLRWAETGTHGSMMFSCGITVTVSDSLCVEPSHWPGSPLRILRELPRPGCVSIPETGVTFAAEQVMVSRPPEAVTADSALIPVDAVAQPLVVRSIKDGDRIRPLGMSGTKSARDHLRDAGINAEQRRRFLALADANGILWLPGVALDERARISALPCPAWQVRIDSESAES